MRRSAFDLYQFGEAGPPASWRSAENPFWKKTTDIPAARDAPITAFTWRISSGVPEMSTPKMS